MILLEIDSTRVVLVVLEEACSLCHRIGQIVTMWRQLLTGTFTWSQLIGLIPDEDNINSAQGGLELINVPDGHTCGLA